MDSKRVAVEDLLEFPTTFSFKAVGHHDLAWVQALHETVRDTLGGRPVQRRERLSRNGTYVSVTLTTEIDDADQLRAVYARLRATEGVITVL